MEEVFKDVVGFEGLYQVSNLGRIKSIGNNLIMKPNIIKNGYLQIELGFQGSRSNSRKCYLVHRLVAIAFIPNQEDKATVNHKDGVKDNNVAENLEWNTQKENVRHAHKSGLIKPQKGEENGFSKHKDSQIIEIRNLYATKNYSQRELAKIFNCSQCNIGSIIRRKSWNHI